MGATGELAVVGATRKCASPALDPQILDGVVVVVGVEEPEQLVGALLRDVLGYEQGLHCCYRACSARGLPS